MPMMMPMGGKTNPEDEQKRNFLDWLHTAHPNNNFPSATAAQIKKWAKAYCKQIGYADVDGLIAQIQGWQQENTNGARADIGLEQPNSQIPQVLEFLDWLASAHPELDITKLAAADLPTLVNQFSATRSYNDPHDIVTAFSQELANPAVVRYYKVPYHAMFLFRADSNFPDFLAHEHEDLDAISGDAMDFYYSLDKLEQAKSAFRTITQFRSLKIDPTLLPSLLMWGKQLSESRAIPLLDLKPEHIVTVVVQIVTMINANQSLEVIGSTAIAKVQELSGKQAPVTTIIQEANNTNITIEGNVNATNSNVGIGRGVSIGIAPPNTPQP